MSLVTILNKRPLRRNCDMTSHKHIQKHLLTLFIGVFLAISSIAYAQENVEPNNYVAFRVLAERTNVQGGDEIWVGVEQSIYPEWHTYWINPGDSGTATRHNWTLPDGFEISDIQWPVPEKIPYEPLLNYGYSNLVMPLQKLLVPEDLPEGPITLSVDVDVLVCKDICIPEYGTFDLVLNDPNNIAEDNSGYFERALAKLPQKVEWASSYSYDESNFSLNIELTEEFLANINQNSLAFIPFDWGVVENAAIPDSKIEKNIFRITQAVGERDISSLQLINGVLAYNDLDGHYKGIAFESMPGGLNTGTNPNNDFQTDTKTLSEKEKVAATGFLNALILALLGGLVLNLMPCVFPVLSLKALSLAKISEKNSNLARMHGLSYTAGIVLSFLLLASVLIALQAGGQQIGWGFQLQNPIIISLLAYLLFLIGLNLAGFFEISNTFGNTGQKLTQGDGLGASFFTGVLATIVATPCTAPFMGVAIGYALLQPAYVSLSVFAALGLGLALPYLALAFVPKLQKSMPKPGAWMDVFKQLLAFPMFAFAAWLVWVLAGLAGSSGVLGILLGMVLITFAIWLGKVKPAQGKLRTTALIFTIISVLGAVVLIPVKTVDVSKLAQGSNAGEKELNYIGFSPTTLQEALAGKDPVFVEMTADWCITCKVNHSTSINRTSTINLFHENNVQYLLGDWTNRDSDITQYLTEFGRNGVPIYVFYGAPDPKTNLRPEPVVLPQILTPGIVANAVQGN